MKKYLKFVPFLAVAILVGVTVAYAGNLTPPGSPAKTMKSLSDLYQLINTGTNTPSTDFTTPGTVLPTMYSLGDAYDLMTTKITAIDASKILTGTTIFRKSGSATGPGLPKTGQTTVYQTNDDGTYQKGSTVSPRFTNNANGTVTDNATGLMWIKDHNAVGAPFNAGMTWTNAITNCEALSYAGQTDWRLPNVKELQSIADYGRYDPAIDPLFTNTQSDLYWSSTTLAYDTASAWYVNFGSGSVVIYDKTSSISVRCVR